MPKLTNAMKRRAAKQMAGLATASQEPYARRPKRAMTFSWKEGDLVEIRKSVYDRYTSTSYSPGTVAMVLSDPTAPYTGGSYEVDLLIEANVVKGVRATLLIKHDHEEII